MIKLSSGMTIFFKYVIPLTWTIFFGSFIGASLIMMDSDVYVGTTYFKILLVSGFLGWCILMYFTIFKLKRVEGGRAGIVVSNYFRHIHLSFERISQFDEIALGPFLLIRVRFVEKTYFGKKIYFLASKKRFQQFVEENAHQLQKK